MGFSLVVKSVGLLSTSSPWAQYLWLEGLVAPRHVGSSGSRCPFRVSLTTGPPGKFCLYFPREISCEDS